MKGGFLCFVFAAIFALPALAAADIQEIHIAPPELCTCGLFHPVIAAGDRTITDAEGKSVVLRESPRPEFFHYTNERSPFTVDVPALFTHAVVIPDNGDGIILRDTENKARFRASGGRLVGKLTVRELFKFERKNLGVKPAYAKLGNNFFVLSWVENGNIHYRKLILNGDAWADMEMSYPPERKKEFDPLVTHSAQSLKSLIE